MFVPPRCPYAACSTPLDPAAPFFHRDGRYKPRCRAHPVQRFRCRVCRRRFSRQSFRADRNQKKPHLNAPFLRLMLACVALRQAARVLGVARRTVERRFLWLARHAAGFHGNRLLPLAGPFMLDELETFEGNRYQPVTVPVLIEPRSFFLIASAAGPLRRKGRMTEAQRRRRAEHEAVHGRRPSQSAAAVREVLRRLRPCAGGPVVLHSDRKPLYRRLGRRLFGSRFTWVPHSASARRDRENPLFPINHTHARLRHFLARLRRRSWCVSKRRLRLQQHLQIATLWVNYCRPITNRTGITPAQALGLAPRRWREEEVLAWREDWGRLPMAA
jgi:transposase-like protein